MDARQQQEKTIPKLTSTPELRINFKQAQKILQQAIRDLEIIAGDDHH